MCTIPNYIIITFFNISPIYFRLFLIISPWKRAGSFRSFEQTWIPFVQWCCVSSLVDIGPLVLEESNSISSMYFCYYLIISSWESSKKILNPCHSRMLYANFVSPWTNLYPRCSRMLFAIFLPSNWLNGYRGNLKSLQQRRKELQRLQTPGEFRSEKLTWVMF